ncbi:MAG: sulfite exporter TauE/SafE family protein [Hyphomonadaceae bacterium]
MDFFSGDWRALAEGFLLFLGVGFLAQLVDGALGMAYGVICSTTLLAFGVPPAQASAMIHAAECCTTAASGASHMAHRNIDWGLFLRLAPAGVLGGVAGAYVLTGVDPTFMKAMVIAYLAILGVLILARAIRGLKESPPHVRFAAPLGLVGGFLDASGGGGWGPVVASTLMGRGHTPRYVIGTVNATEFLVTLAISATFIWAFVTGRVHFAGGVSGAGAALGGLIIGGLIAAPIAGYITKILPARALMAMVGVLVVGLALWQGVQLWPKLISHAFPMP